jgi:hypothetical protein
MHIRNPYLLRFSPLGVGSAHHSAILDYEVHFQAAAIFTYQRR